MSRARKSFALLIQLVLIYGIVGLSLACLFACAVQARDLDGKYADSPLKAWFDQLKSGKGLCCSLTDGFPMRDADWDNHDGHYRVRIPREPDSTDMIWVDVPDEALVTEPNKFGRTMVWPVYTIGADPPVWIRCFMPGPMT
jgi:hypothetical protein